MTNDRESVVRAVVEAFHQAFNEGFTGPADYATEDWNHISPNGGATRTREETLRTVRAAHKSFLKGVTATVKTMDVRFASDEVAVATVVSTSSAFTAPDGVKHEPADHIRTFVVVMRNGRWLIMQDHNTTIVPLGR